MITIIAFTFVVLLMLSGVFFNTYLYVRGALRRKNMAFLYSRRESLVRSDKKHEAALQAHLFLKC